MMFVYATRELTAEIPPDRYQEFDREEPLGDPRAEDEPLHEEQSSSVEGEEPPPAEADGGVISV